MKCLAKSLAMCCLLSHYWLLRIPHVLLYQFYAFQRFSFSLWLWLFILFTVSLEEQKFFKSVFFGYIFRNVIEGQKYLICICGSRYLLSDCLRKSLKYLLNNSMFPEGLPTLVFITCLYVCYFGDCKVLHYSFISLHSPGKLNV